MMHSRDETSRRFRRLGDIMNEYIRSMTPEERDRLISTWIAAIDAGRNVNMDEDSIAVSSEIYAKCKARIAAKHRARGEIDPVIPNEP